MTSQAQDGTIAIPADHVLVVGAMGIGLRSYLEVHGTWTPTPCQLIAITFRSLVRGFLQLFYILSKVTVVRSYHVAATQRLQYGLCTCGICNLARYSGFKT